MGLNRDQHLEIYKYLCLTRALEDWIYYICANQNPQKPLIIGKGYLSTGQEAVSVGAAYGLEERDWVAQSHRDFGCLLLRGLSVDDLLMQYFSKVDGPTKGRDANVHLGDTQKHILGFISHMGALLPVANGVAFAAKYKGDDAVTLAFFGDGASSQGIVHEAMNYAAVYKLNVVFICNNNRWAISTPIEEQFAVENIADRAAGYGMPGAICDGNQVYEVYETVKKAIDHARGGGGPSLIECKTMRMAGHGTHDRAKYVPDEEMNFWKNKDPIKNAQSFLVKAGYADEKYFKEMARWAQAEVEAATERVRDYPEPTSDGQLEDVFAP